MRIIVINLDQDTDRRQRIESRLLELGLPWERLPAVDGRRLTPRQEALIDRAGQTARGLRISPGAIGCWLSHRQAHRMIADGTRQMALVLEDDLLINDNLPGVLERMERGAAGSFDVVRLHRFKVRRSFVPVRHIAGGDTIGFVCPVDSGAQAYVMTREAANRLIESIPRMVHLADHALYEHWTHGLVVCSIDPPVVYHCDQGRSSISARRASGTSSFEPAQWLRRKRHQIHKKYIRRVAFHRMLNRYSRTGHLSGLS